MASGRDRGVYDLVAALDDPTVLDQHGALWERIDADVEAACWLDSDRLLVSGHPDEEPFDGDDQPTPIVAVHPDGTRAAAATTSAIVVIDLPS